MVSGIYLMVKAYEVGISRVEADPIKANGHCENEFNYVKDSCSNILCEQQKCTEIM